MTTPTDAWLAAIPEMAPLQGPAGTAERLLLLIHYGIDWQSGWVTGRRGHYWEQILPDRAVAATFSAATLRRWWCRVAAEVESHPRGDDELAETEQLLRYPAGPVLEIVRHETPALLLRTRLTTAAVRAQRDTEERHQ